jgi:hypothetical protein
MADRCRVRPFLCPCLSKVIEGQAGVGEKAGDQVLAPSDALDALGGGVSDLDQSGRGHIGQLHILEIGPQILDRVELGGVGREPLSGEPVALAVQLGTHLGVPVRGEPIPDQHDSMAGVEGGELVEDADEGVGVTAGLLHVKAQPGRSGVGPVAQGGGHGGLLPAEPVPQDRRLAPG